MTELLGITMGCPVGIGPEIIVRFHAGLVTGRFLPVVLGDPGVLERCAAGIGGDTRVVRWQPGEKYVAGAINVLPLSDLPRDLVWGKPDSVTGLAMGSYIVEAVKLIKEGVLAGMVTCPITKSALNQAGFDYPGHTEMLAALSGGIEHAMMLAGKSLRVTLVTIHVSLAAVPELLSVEKIVNLIGLTGRSLQQDFAIPAPRIAVAGLNPHSGEDGIFGTEEREMIGPAVAQARKDGWLVEGPFPPDTVFNKAVAGKYDAVVCMYHDQGLIPFKLLHFADGVNITLGLPLVRTSVDHGTAYDIAGRWQADPASLGAAYRQAEEIIINRSLFAENH
ncbi:MAG: 4-hydroxythreonine-4-phosphate dehydrogenase PdxA [Proteobacteria bacterium]|nr:4-hydroxythreonine-4-phosphate dehydrogenase PdxA [Pseudomonadota bacterium]MBU1737359.1 4-hydroxythreonine-4-phosphate dehydrogenase PdxA [Pseudomonadota bacterium]